MYSRFYQAGDEKAIVKLHNTVFNSDMDIETWRWWNLNSPYGQGISKTMFDDDMAVGHYAVVPRRLAIEGVNFKAVMAINAMTHPDYRGETIFTQLASDIFKCCEINNFSLLYGFPNENVYDTYLKYYDWVGFGKSTTWLLDIDELNYVPDFVFPVKNITIFDHNWDHFYNASHEAHLSNMVPRTAQHLNWRYFSKPNNNYVVLGVHQGGWLLGYVVLKIYEEKTGHIIDMFSDGNRTTTDSLMYHALNYFVTNSIDTVSCWFPKYGAERFSLTKTQFKTTEWSSYFGVKFLTLNEREKEFSKQKNQWRMTMGDSDVF